MSSTGSKPPIGAAAPEPGRGRREFLAHAAAGGACLLTFSIAGCERKLTPTQAREANVAFRTLTADEVKTVEALGETLLPGSARAGLAHYLDHQLSGDPADSMLMIKYLRVPAPFTDFYRGGLRATNTATRAAQGKSFAELSSPQATDLVARMSAGQLTPWEGPPAALFYFVLRSDAVDVMYGTQSGFALLGVPYMAHIEPPSRWGE
jgi:hypothetical protein